MSKERLWSPMFVAIVACTLCCFLVGQGSNAGTTVYLERIGGSTGLAGIGALIFSLAAAVSRIITGPMSDSRGRRLVMVVGSCFMLAGTIGPLFGNSDALFVLWRVLQGFGFAAATTASATAAADVLPLSRLGEGIGYYGLGQAIAMSCGPALAIFLISTDPPENFYFGLSACAALALVFSLMCRYEKNPRKLPATSEFRLRWEKDEVPYLRGHGEGTTGSAKAERVAHGSASEGVHSCHAKESGCSEDERPLAQPNPGRPSMGERLRKLADGIFEPTALPGTIPMMLIATSFGFGIFYMGVYGNHLGVGNAGIFYTVSAVAMIVVRLTSGRFMDRFKPIYIMGVAVAAGLVCYAVLVACSLLPSGGVTEWAFYASGVFYGISLGLSLPVNQAVAVRLSPPSRWGAANGLYLLGNDVSIGIASLAWGFLAPALGYTVTLCIVMACIAASFFAALACYPKETV